MVPQMRPPGWSERAFRRQIDRSAHAPLDVCYSHNCPAMATRPRGGPISRSCQRKQQKISGKRRCLIRINRLCARLCCNPVTEAIKGLTRGSEKARPRLSTCQSKIIKPLVRRAGLLKLLLNFDLLRSRPSCFPVRICATMRYSAR